MTGSLRHGRVRLLHPSPETGYRGLKLVFNKASLSGGVVKNITLGLTIQFTYSKEKKKGRSYFI